MDDPDGTQSAADYADGDDPVVPPAHVLPHDHHSHPEQSAENKHEGTSRHSHLGPSPRHWWRLSHYVHFEKIGWDRFVELILAAVIALFAIFQYLSSRSTSQQIQTMIDAANQIKDASWRFSGAAQGIEYAGWSAVGRLNDQATQLGNNVTQTSRLASDTEAANSNVTASDRPWIGGIINVSNFDGGKKATFTITYTNSGKRPAILDATLAVGNFYTAFPANPEAEYLRVLQETKEMPSKSVLVPGSYSQLTFTSDREVSGELLDLAAKDPPPVRFYVLSTAKYRDLRTNDPHYTRICLVYYPKLKSPSDAGFRNCNEYNDAN